MTTSMTEGRLRSVSQRVPAAFGSTIATAAQISFSPFMLACPSRAMIR